MSKEKHFQRSIIKKLFREKKFHDENFNRVSKDIDNIRDQMKKNEKRFDLIRNK